MSSILSALVFFGYASLVLWGGIVEPLRQRMLTGEWPTYTALDDEDTGWPGA